MGSVLVGFVSAFSFNLSHLIQLPLMLIMMGCLIMKYGKIASGGGRKLPLQLQIPGAILCLIYPVQEFTSTELTQGLQKKGWESNEFGLWANGIFMPLLNGVGIALTIAASYAASRMSQENKPCGKTEDGHTAGNPLE